MLRASLKSPFIVFSAVSISTLLLGAACLKLMASFTEYYYFRSAYRISDLALALLIAVVELSVGFQLYKHPFKRITWSISCALFLVFSAISFAKGLAHLQVCDCFGTLIVQPYYIAAMDLVVAGLCGAIAFLSRDSERTNLWGFLVNSLLALALVVTTLAVLYVREVFAYGLFRLPPIAGAVILPKGHEHSGVQEASFLAAARGEGVRLIGYSPSCKIRLVGQFPQKVPTDRITHIPLEIRSMAAEDTGLIPLTLYAERDGALYVVNLSVRPVDEMRK